MICWYHLAKSDLYDYEATEVCDLSDPGRPANAAEMLLMDEYWLFTSDGVYKLQCEFAYGCITIKFKGAYYYERVTPPTYVIDMFNRLVGSHE